LTAQPSAAWVQQQAHNALLHRARELVRPTMLLRDHDSKFPAELDALLDLKQAHQGSR
jgi:hypothetical protein